MAADLLDLADRLWRGETDIADHHPIAGMWGEMAELGHGAAFVAAFSNVAAFASDEGMVLVDTSSPFLAGRVHDVLQSWRDEPLHTAVFTHGHIDHVFGVERYEADVVRRIGEIMTRIITGAMHEGPPSPRDLAVARTLQQVWLSALIGWVGGVDDAPRVISDLEVATQLLLED